MLKGIYYDLILRRQIMDYRMHYLERHGTSDIMAYLDNFDGRHRKTIERSILQCGAHIRLTDRAAWWRGLQIAKGHTFRLLVRQQIPPDAF
jgi:hypothetical protein